MLLSNSPLSSLPRDVGVHAAKIAALPIISNSYLAGDV
jgi:hypothetical protein